ncbi:hypothetical protein [Sphingobium sp.]|uniref:hypothetical protein n=1 Tax=Sphingobium sp. TaxID=1912891 RepID=UPI0028BE21C8|nr:hypothetical protein [Sphingobium sp.]
MNAGKTLFPMTLALIAGCSPAADRQASKGERSGDAKIIARPAAATEAAPRREGAAREHPPVPLVLPALGDTQRGRNGKEDAGPATAATPAMAVPLQPPSMKPFAADIPPRASVPDLPPSDDAADPRPFPDEVTRYMVDRDGCDHFRSEEAYDAERLAFLEENIAELCTGADARLAMLRQRYAHDPAVMSALGSYDDRIEGNASQ